MTVVVWDLIQHLMKFEWKQILTWGSTSMCHGEIGKSQTPQLPVLSILSVNSVNIDESGKWNMNFLRELTIVIPWLHYVFSIAKHISSTIDKVNSVSSETINPVDFAMKPVAFKCFGIELVWCSDGWWRTWPMIHMISGQLVSSVMRCNENPHKGAWLESFQAIDHFEPTILQAC